MPGMVLTLPKLAYPHGASSCPLILDFVSCRSLAVNIAASQVTQYGRFCTYKSQHGISETNEGDISTADVFALLIFFLLHIRDDNFLSKRKSLISMRSCAYSHTHVI